MEWILFKRNLNSSSDDDAHQEVGDDAGDSHHQALNNGDTGVEAEHEEEVMCETRVEADHEVAYGSREEGDCYQERHC